MRNRLGVYKMERGSMCHPVQQDGCIGGILVVKVSRPKVVGNTNDKQVNTICYMVNYLLYISLCVIF